MSKKTLNLSIEEPIKRRAKRIARQRGMSVSQFFEELVVAQKESDAFTPEPGSITASLAGSVELPEKYKNMDYKEIKQKILAEKYAN